MYRNQKVGIAIPAYNEQKLLKKTVDELPDFIDHIVIVEDGSSDSTWDVVKDLMKSNKKVLGIKNKTNRGIGYSLITGFKECFKLKCDIVGITAGDAQCDPNYLKPMLEDLLKYDVDYIKANRFMHRDALKAMPKYRRIGNIVITLLTKFSTGYYSIFDTQNGFGFFKAETLKKVNFDFVGERYDYENTMLVALSIIGAKVKDHPVPAIYGEETSTIKFLPTALRAIKAVFIGFWRRVYYKYVIYNFHPIALFLFSGMLFCLFGITLGAFVVYEKIFNDVSPTTGTTMLVALPLFLGFQLLLTSFIMDMNNEDK